MILFQNNRLLKYEQEVTSWDLTEREGSALRKAWERYAHLYLKIYKSKKDDKKIKLNLESEECNDLFTYNYSHAIKEIFETIILFDRQFKEIRNVEITYEINQIGVHPVDYRSYLYSGVTLLAIENCFITNKFKITDKSRLITNNCNDLINDLKSNNIEKEITLLSKYIKASHEEAASLLKTFMKETYDRHDKSVKTL